MTDQQIDAAAAAIRDAANTFSRPVGLYVEGEARRRWEEANPDLDAYLDRPGVDWKFESWKILARAALSAVQ